jgi:hypothetical protein
MFMVTERINNYYSYDAPQKIERFDITTIAFVTLPSKQLG